MITQNQSTQASMTAKNALALLQKGNERFLANSPIARDNQMQIKDTTDGQYPFAVILSCIDSRVPIEKIFDLGIGDIFGVRVAGNVVNKDVLGSIEYACKVVGSKLVLVLGHSSCGAVKGACDNVQLGNISQMLAKIVPSVQAVASKTSGETNSKNASFVQAVAEQNVAHSMKQIAEESDVMSELCAQGKVEVVGAMYDVGIGHVTFMDN